MKQNFKRDLSKLRNRHADTKKEKASQTKNPSNATISAFNTNEVKTGGAPKLKPARFRGQSKEKD